MIQRNIRRVKIDKITLSRIAQTILKRGRARADEIEFIIEALEGRDDFIELRDKLSPGKVPKNLRSQLEDLIDKLEDESEEE